MVGLDLREILAKEIVKGFSQSSSNYSSFFNDFISDKIDKLDFSPNNCNLCSDFEKVIYSMLEFSKEEKYGDFALPCFLFSKYFKKNPIQIAELFSELLNNFLLKESNSIISKIIAVGPYVNFSLKGSVYLSKVCDFLINKRLNFNFLSDFAYPNVDSILIEYPSPNTNKSLHVGHIRNILLGNSISKLLKKIGVNLIKTNLNNDRGIAVCKSMLGYKLFYKNESPESLSLKSDHFVSQCYVRFEKEAQLDSSLNDLAQETLQKWENGDKEVLSLWKKILNWVYEGYFETYKKFKVGNFNKEYFESEIYNKGKEIILNALKNKVKGFEKDDSGAVICDLTDVGLDKKILLRSDGTTIYITQDIYLAKLKKDEFNPDKSIFIVAKEQEYHFKVLFELLSRLGISNKETNVHFGYGYVFNKDGKKFSSRKGEVVSADWLYDKVLKAVKSVLKNKDFSKSLNEKILNERAEKITYSVLSFTFLKPNPLDDIKFDIEKSLSFEGDTGPYILYTYARFCSILKKLGLEDYSLFTDKERLIEKIYEFLKSDYNEEFSHSELNILKKISVYPDLLLESSKKLKISLIANFVLSVAKLLNEFYQKESILREYVKSSQNRKVLVILLSLIVLLDSLDILDIVPIHEM